MSETVPIQFGTQFAVHKSSGFSSELAENLFLEKAPQGARVPYILLGTPGHELFVTVGAGPIRGAHFFNNYLLVVSGDTLYRVSALGVTENLGHIAGTALVSMADNGIHTWIATGTILYAANDTAIIQVPVPNGEGITHCTYQDGYLIGVIGGTQNVYISGLDDATTIGALDYTTADTLPGYCVGCISNHREVAVFKTDSIEFFYNSGAAAFPFQRTQISERGCVSPFSICKYGGALFFLGDDLQVYSLSGYAPSVISTPPVAQAIKSETSPQTAYGYVYSDEGHVFYVLTFRTITLAYDLTTGLWHKRKKFESSAHGGTCHAFSNLWRKNLIGDVSNGNVYEMKSDVYSDNGTTITRKAVGTTIANSGKRFVIDEFFLDIETGVGLNAGAGSSPVAVLRWSSDGGKTWSAQLSRSIGKIGEYKTRVIWNALGAHHSWIPEITVSDPVPVRIIGAGVKITALTA